MRTTTPLSVGVLIVACLASFTPLTAEEPAVPTAMSFTAWEKSVERTDVLEAEVKALRERLDAVGSERVLCEKPCCDHVCPGWNASVEYLNWRLRRRGLDFAITTDDTVLATGVGDVQNLTFGRDSGIRTGLSYTTVTGWEVGFDYTHFNTQTTSAAAAPPGGAMWATRTHPSQNEEALTASALGELDYDIYDLEVRRWFDVNRFAAFQFLGGLRWADIDQNLRYDYDGNDFSNGVFTNPVNMQGFGVRLGAAGYWQLPRGFSLVARGAGTLAYGKFHTRILETNLSGADTVVDITDEYQQAVPALEAALGGAWRNERFEISGGYEVTNWFDVADRSMFVDSVHEGAYSPSSMNLLLDGFFLRGAVAY